MTKYEGLLGRVRNVPIALRHPSLARRFLKRPIFPDLIDISPGEIAAHLPQAPVIVEAGAYNGDDTLRLAAQWPDAVIYPFEPVPELFDVLCRRLAHLPNVRPQPYALGTADGKAEMWLSRSEHLDTKVGAASAIIPPTENTLESKWLSFEGRLEVPMRTLDSWMAEQGISRVDFAWLDLQGVELPVLAASPLFTDSLMAACLEVSRVELYRGQALYAEVMAWMKSRAFKPVINRVPVPFGNILFARDRGPAA